MNRNRKFCYQLEPILLSRQWDLEALLLDFGKINQSYATRKAEVSSLQNALAFMSNQWQAQIDNTPTVYVDTLTLMMHYLRDLALQIQEKKAALDMLEHERNALIDQVAAARRAVEAIEHHKEQKKMCFISLRLNEDFKTMDDHWSTLHGRALQHDSKI